MIISFPDTAGLSRVDKEGRSPPLIVAQAALGTVVVATGLLDRRVLLSARPGVVKGRQRVCSYASRFSVLSGGRYCWLPPNVEDVDSLAALAGPLCCWAATRDALRLPAGSQAKGGRTVPG